MDVVARVAYGEGELKKGQMVEGALLRTALTFFSPTLIEEDKLTLGRVPSLNRSQTAGPSDIYKAKDGWITVAVNGDPLFRRAAKLIGAPLEARVSLSANGELYTLLEQYVAELPALFIV